MELSHLPPGSVPAQPELGLWVPRKSQLLLLGGLTCQASEHGYSQRSYNHRAAEHVIYSKSPVVGPAAEGLLGSLGVGP